ncbi:dimethyl sulfoxide reductase [Rodentibacter trehalosifermentans]|uniref:Dimethyl sulfoxide reductase n=1 Tax=Rodentibacter trehalosifermentans TaxID=1908263 RepID=A0A1V3IMC9_9PAST|nr:dimethyl sulfoxide reductase anchor subunit family protein [Rodentibacter trehalosifermentans]OOF43333.1 dimethyl sulfoxide reductase [Rodentibacter trehalosifermentans]OOF47541.1 dimethyl sulfoxide reductase [Rodentibacter trehalosifermentans]
MNAGLHELPLVFFTILAQSAVGAWLVFTFVLLNTKNEKSRAYIHKVMFVILAFLGVGFIASITHLGSPMRAFNSLNRVGESMMSNEILSGAIFFSLAGFYWLVALTGKMPVVLGNLWRITTALVGVVFMYVMNQVYHIVSVPTWDTSLTSWSFYLTVALGGLALAYALLIPNKHREYSLNFVPSLFAISLLFAAIVAVYQGFGLPHIHSAIQNAADLVSDYAVMTSIRLCLLAIAAYLLFCTGNRELLGCAVVLTLVAEGIGRVLFYGLHMTLGMTIGS